jgi:anti-sigma regulatory factor (Ser/Thr protein kinase)
MAISTATSRHTVRYSSHPSRPSSGRPWRAVLNLDALPTAIGCARAWTRQMLSDWRLAGLSDTAEVIVSELATNAMLASRRMGHQFIRLTLMLDQGELTIMVRDDCPGSPQPKNASDDEENGRGLFLVEAMSSRSGWHPSGDGTPGKVVWAALPS